MQIPHKYAGVAIGAIVSTVMSFLMSLFVTYMNIGLRSDFLELWIPAFAAAWPMAFCLAIVITPLAKKWVENHVGSNDDIK